MTDERNVRLGAETILSTQFSDVTFRVYNDKEGKEYPVLIYGNPSELPENIDIRVHDACITGETFHSLQCECREQLHESMKLLAQKKQGIIIYLPQEGRGIGLTNKIRAYALQKEGLDTVEANVALDLPEDARSYKAAGEILHQIGVTSFSLLTNNPRKVRKFEELGFTVARKPLEIPPTKKTEKYLKTKKEKMDHFLSLI